MIPKLEIQQKALKLNIEDKQIEKDYILSCLLEGLAEHNDLSKILAFKGGGRY